MLRPPSLQAGFDLVFSGDPALDLPDVPKLDPATATADELATRDHIAAERTQKLKVARERGNWAAITKPGQKPTVFKFEPVGGSAVRWWQGESERHRLTTMEDIELIFRLALVEVDCLGGFELKRDHSGKFPLVSVKSMDALYAAADGAGAALVMELGMLVVERALGGVPPLS